MITYFMAKTDFFSPELQSGYCKGLIYKIRDDNKRLAQLAQQWQSDGKVILGVKPKSFSQTVSGRGTVESKRKGWLSKLHFLRKEQ